MILLTRISVLLSTLLLFLASAYAFPLDIPLDDKKLEDRAIHLFKITKCLICLGESIYDSQSQFAYDMRIFIRDQIRLKYSNEEIINQLRKTYGNQIINIPPYKPSTALLWYAPSLIFIMGIILLVFNILKA